MDLLQVLSLQQCLLQSKREVLERLGDFRIAKIAVEEAAGPSRSKEKKEEEPE